MKKILIITLCFMLIFVAAPNVFADETADTSATDETLTASETNAPESVPSGSYTVFLQTNEYSSYQWYAWTWGEGTDRWISPSSGYNTAVKFENLDSNVVFAFSGSANPNPTWDIMTKQTVDIKLDGINNMVVLDGENSEGKLTGYLTMYDEPTEATDNTSATNPTVEGETTATVAPGWTEPTGATEGTYYTQPTSATQATQPTPATEATQPTPATEATQPTPATEATQPTAQTQATQATSATQKPTKYTMPTVIHTEATEITQNHVTPGSKQTASVSPKLNLKTATVKCGKVITLKVSYRDSQKVKFSSSNSSVASVTSKGKVSALKKGFARITAKVGSKKLYFTIKVTTSPKLSESKVTVKKKKCTYITIVGKASTVNNVYTNTNRAKILSKKNAVKLKIKGLKKGSTALKIKVNGVVLKLKVKVK